MSAFPEPFGEVPERGYSFLGGLVRRPGPFPREEVEAALKTYFELAKVGTETGNWDPWADLFTEDAIYVEHSMGIMRGREAIRAWVKSSTGEKPMATIVAPDWYLIENDLVIVYTLNMRPAPDGGDPYQFVGMSPFVYAGDGKWSYEEDVTNPNEIVRTATLAAKARVARSEE
jgi:hypothetical protein